MPFSSAGRDSSRDGTDTPALAEDPVYEQQQDNLAIDSSTNARKVGSADRGCDSYISPYAVRYVEDGDNSGADAISKDEAPEDADIDPYAVTYMGQDEQTLAKVSFKKTQGATNLSEGSSTQTVADTSVRDDNRRQESSHACLGDYTSKSRI
uniref:Uncharacterized protein n=1 Tax=Branchiostoma floridae TaxID=7739 RepID=C3Z6I0_BRAFL|eukprot:XP_002595812.1 hypothetical protein BRAFLDRAFT_96786 [Branchiostoma floridae]